MICPNCKNTVPDGENFCTFCGANLKAGQTPQPDQKPPEQSQPQDQGWMNFGPQSGQGQQQGPDQIPNTIWDPGQTPQSNQGWSQNPNQQASPNWGWGQNPPQDNQKEQKAPDQIPNTVWDPGQTPQANQSWNQNPNQQNSQNWGWGQNPPQNSQQNQPAPDQIPNTVWDPGQPSGANPGWGQNTNPQTSQANQGWQNPTEWQAGQSQQPNTGWQQDPGQQQGSAPASADPYADWGFDTNPNASETPKQKKKSRAPLIAGISVLVVALIAAAVALVLHFLPRNGGNGDDPATLGSNPPGTEESEEPVDDKAIVKDAFRASVEAYTTAAKGMIPEALSTLYQGAQSQELSLTLGEISGIPDLSIDPTVLSGLGLRLATDIDMENEAIAADLSAFYGAADIIGAQAAINGNTVKLCIPAITGDTVYGLDTSKLGSWLVGLGADAAFENLTVQPFQIIDKAQETLQNFTGQYNLDPLKDALDDLVDAMEVVPLEGASTRTINGVECTGYLVTIPQSALEDLADAIVNMPLPSSQEIVDPLMELIGLLQLPQDTMNDIRYSLEDAFRDLDSQSLTDARADILQQVKDALAKIGDVAIETWVSDGLVQEMHWVDTVNPTGEDGGDAALDCTITLGGADNYADGFSIVLKITYQGNTAAIQLTSEGDHTGASGTYSDTTRLAVLNDATGETLAELVSDFRYTPMESAAEDVEENFHWILSLNGDGETVALTAKGLLLASPDSVSLSLSELSLSGGGVKLGLTLEYSVQPYEQRISLDNPIMLNDLSLNELQQELQKLTGALAQFALNLMYGNPALSGLLNGLGI